MFVFKTKPELVNLKKITTCQLINSFQSIQCVPPRERRSAAHQCCFSNFFS